MTRLPACAAIVLSMAGAQEAHARRDAADQAAGPAAAAARCVVIPLKGRFGSDVLAEGVREALEATRRLDAGEVVLEIDSEGGSFGVAEEIVGLLAEHDERLRYHAVVTRAVGPAMCVAPFCDTVWMSRSAPTGVAMAFSLSADALPADVPSPEALAADVCARMRAPASAAPLLRAMFVRDAEVYRITSPEGVTTLAPAVGDLTHETVQIDGPRTLLALSASQAVHLGFARWIEKGADVGTMLEGRPWRSAGEAGSAAMRRAAERQERAERDAAKLRDDVERLRMVLEDSIGFAHEQDPRGYYDELHGRFTPTGRRAWRRDIDRAIDAWERATDVLRELHGAVRKLEKLTGEVALPEVELKHFAERIDREVEILLQKMGQDGP